MLVSINKYRCEYMGERKLARRHREKRKKNTQDEVIDKSTKEKNTKNILCLVVV